MNRRETGTSSSNVTDPAFLLDTNVCIYLLGGEAPAAKARAEQCSPGELATSAITFGEVMVGVRTLHAMGEARALFELITVLPFDEAAATAYASLPFRRGSFDRLIAAHALARNLVLVTNNPRDFADIFGLKIENWARP
jgi:tRNA(fMet)-specific endonuclease VapC